jgi:AcrR family transcriptional regulator
MNSETETAPPPADAAPAPPRLSRGPGRPTLSNEALLDKALEIFLDKGFERTSIDAITAAAGVAKRTVYLRYEDKTALFKAALERAIEEWIVPIETLRAAETDDFEETLLRVGRILVANVMSPKGLQLLRITNAEAGRMPEISAFTNKAGTERTLVYLAELIRRHAPEVDELLADADEAALAFMNLVVGGPPVMAAWGVVLDEATIDRHTRYGVRMFLHGLLARASTSDGAPRETPAAASLPQALEEENRRLRKLLVEAMLETAALKEAGQQS